MKVIPLPAFTDNYIWVIMNSELGVFDCVDPGEAHPVLQFSSERRLTLRSILLTHHHHDHIGGVGELMNAFPTCKVYSPMDPRIPIAHNRVKKEDTLVLEPYCYRILSNPGHTSTHISYYEADEGWLFCGDTLFCAGCGRVFDGTMEQLHQSMQLFKSLPPSTNVFCAHEYTRQNLRFAQTVEPNNEDIQEQLIHLNESATTCSLPSTIGLEQAINPFFRTEIPAVKQYATDHGALNEDSLEVFRTLRIQKNLFQ